MFIGSFTVPENNDHILSRFIPLLMETTSTILQFFHKIDNSVFVTNQIILYLRHTVATHLLSKTTWGRIGACSCPCSIVFRVFVTTITLAPIAPVRPDSVHSLT